LQKLVAQAATSRTGVESRRAKSQDQGQNDRRVVELAGPMMRDTISDSPPKSETIEATFRNGSLTALSVLLGFSLSFVARWAGLPGAWSTADLLAVSSIATGITVQLVAIGLLLSVRSLLLHRYNRAVALFLLGLVFVAVGTGVAIVGDIFDVPQHVL
jgi:hypothetical protein